MGQPPSDREDTGNDRDDAAADFEPEDREDDEPVELVIEDALDLHYFHPREVKDVVEEYLVQCRARGFSEVRIIHGRGKGHQRAVVRALLEQSPHVLSFHDAEGARGGWGATVVELRPGPAAQ